MKKGFVLAVLSLVLALSAAGCQSNVTNGLVDVVGSGKVITEERPVKGIEGVVNTTSANVVVTQGDEETLTIKGDDNIIGLISTEVRDGILYVEQADTERSFTTNNGLTVNVGVINLTSAQLTGSGNLSAENLMADDLTTELNGSGSMTMSGQVTTQDVTVTGSGSFKGADLQSQTAVVTVSGSGSADIWAEQSLEANLSGSGSVNYWGEPEVQQAATGTGKMNARGSR